MKKFTDKQRAYMYQDFVKFRQKVGYGDILIDTILKDANVDSQKLFKKKEYEESYKIISKVERKISLINRNAIVAMYNDGLGDTSNSESRTQNKTRITTAKYYALFNFSEVIKQAIDTYEEWIQKATHSNEPFKTVFEQYKFYTKINTEEEILMVKRFQILRELSLIGAAHLRFKNINKSEENNSKEIDKFLHNVALIDNIMKNEKAAENGFQESDEDKERIEKEMCEFASSHSEYLKELDVQIAVKDTDFLKFDMLSVARDYVVRGIIDAEVINQAIIGLSAQSIQIWNDFDLTNTVNIAMGILEEQVEKLDLKNDVFNMDLEDESVKSIADIKDTEKLLSLLDTAQKMAVKNLRPEEIALKVKAFKKFKFRNGKEIEPQELVHDLKTYSFLALTGIRELHDRIVCNYMTIEKDTNDKDVYFYNGKTVVASIIFQLFMDRVFSIPEFLRGVECTFKDFLEVTGNVWEMFAQKLDSLLDGITHMYDEDMIRKYQESLKIKLQNYNNEMTDGIEVEDTLDKVE